MVPGVPVALGRHRVARQGHMFNPSAKLQSEFSNSCSKFIPLQPLEGPLSASLIFQFSRPKNHYLQNKNGKILRENSDKYHYKKKDLDNLVKFVLDSLNQKMYLDDGQISHIQAMKLYTDNDNPCTIVALQPLD
jgi:Holliday junction resolvase RusA-like endonuclease